MAVERTLSIIKPDATRRNLTGQINARFEDADLRIVAQRRVKLTLRGAGAEVACPQLPDQVAIPGKMVGGKPSLAGVVETTGNLAAKI